VELDPLGTEEHLQFSGAERTWIDTKAFARLEPAALAGGIAHFQVDRAGTRRPLENPGNTLDFGGTVYVQIERQPQPAGQLYPCLFQAHDARQNEARLLAGALNGRFHEADAI